MPINKDNNCEIKGNVSSVPEHGSYNGKDGLTPYCNFSVAINNRTGDTDFADIKVWGHQAENIKKNTSKGDSIRIWGEYKKKKWKTPNADGKFNYNIYFSLKEYENSTSMLGDKNKPFDTQEMYSSNQALPDTPDRF